MDQNKYNANGVAKVGPPMNQSPPSNPGVVYQPANKPVNTGTIKSGQQVANGTTYFAKDGSNITIGPILDALGNVSSGIQIVDGNGEVTFFIESAGLGFGIELGILLGRLTIQTSPTDTIGALNVTEFGTGNAATITNANSSNFNSVLQVASNAVISSHFLRLINLQAVGHSVHVYTSDGTTPNAVLSGNVGDICLNSSVTGQIAYNNNGTTGWTLL